MTDNANEVTVDNSVLILIDHQPWVAFGGELHRPVAALGRTSKGLSRVNPAVTKNGAGVGLASEQAFAQS
jgi:hypothetical protein